MLSNICCRRLRLAACSWNILRAAISRLAAAILEKVSSLLLRHLHCDVGKDLAHSTKLELRLNDRAHNLQAMTFMVWLLHGRLHQDGGHY